MQVRLIDCRNHCILYEGTAHAETTNRSVVYTFFSADRKYVWRVYPDTLIIDTIGEMRVHLVLKERKNTKGKAESEFGRIDLHCHTSLYKISNHCIEVRYELEAQTFHFRLEVKEEKNAIH